MRLIVLILFINLALAQPDWVDTPSAYQYSAAMTAAVYDIDDLIRQFPAEERIYRHRCVETWAMVVPWAGFPMHQLIIHGLQLKLNF